MIDLALTFSEAGDFDLSIVDGDLLGDEGLASAITVSLFTDRLAREDDPLPGAMPGQKADRRGWWGDLGRDDGRSSPIGSRLWLLDREKELPETVNRAREYAAEALAWLEALGGSYTVEARDERPGRLALDVAAGLAGPDRRTDSWTAFLDYGRGWRAILRGGIHVLD
ncbi:MAG: phage GP46 family protein [Deltaproteobacteria bacterium]|jgi:phage gp46-like protein|nr:phage GP46 family protein [Deltaproteobacteria bacterium]